MVAIPGMNPGAFVAGGGGDGGGGSGKSGGGGGGANGPDGQSGEEGANGGGNGSGACGVGEPGSCTNCGNSFAAGDPVDVSTGRVFTPPKRDLLLPGFFEFEVLRAYSTSRCSIDRGTGHGWALNTDWEFQVGRRDIHVWNGSGLDVRFPLLREAGDQAGRDGWALQRMTDGFILRPGNEFFHYFRLQPDGRGRLMGTSWRNRGRLTFHHENDRLSHIVDTAGRTIHFSRDGRGRLTSLVVPADDGRRVVFAEYEYSGADDLVGVVDADGHAWRFGYDERHRMVWQRFPTGLVFHYRYDREGRCVESWGEHESGQDMAIAPGVPTKLRNGKEAKGILHVCLDFLDEEYTEVSTSESFLRFEHGPEGIRKGVDGVGGVATRTYDRWGHITSHTDAEGATVKWEHDEMGNVLSETDQDGQTIRCKRDHEGRIIESTDAAGGKVEIHRDVHGNVETMIGPDGGVTHYVNDDRGMVTARTSANGARTQYEYDAHGNLTREVLPTGDVREFRYDYWGRLVERVAPNGSVERFERFASGKLMVRTDALGRRTSYTYDGLGNLTSCVRPDGSVVRLHWGGLGWLYMIEHPDGSAARASYNREGWPLEIVNENGATHTYEYDTNGIPVGETYFNGKTQRMRLDARGRVQWVEDSTGKRTFERSPSGQLLREIAPDGTERSYTYDARGELISATTDGATIRLTRSPTGEIVGETLMVDGKEYEVRSTIDPMGRRTSVETSLGLGLRYGRDPLGRLQCLTDASMGQLFTAAYDLPGGQTHRVLVGGGLLRNSFDALGRQRRVQVLSLQGEAGAEPEHVGGFHGSVDLRFDYNDLDEISFLEGRREGKVSYEYDSRRRLTARESKEGRESWKVDPGSNYYETTPGAPERAYAPGDLLVRRGETEFVYDDDGYLIEKHDRSGGDHKAWKYVWGPWRELSRVECPDGRTVEFTYDAFMRRISKRVSRDGVVQRSVLWVWDRNGPVHEVSTDGATGEQRTRTFLYDDDSETIPCAQRDEGSAWVYYVRGIGGAPEYLFDSSGQVGSRIQRATFGRLEAVDGKDATPFRFAGQYEDEETGLFYNRYRYYDPEIGRYISPDPSGLEGGRNLYAYGMNPVGWVDPFGLFHGVRVEAFDVPGIPAGSEFISGADSFPPNDPFFRRTDQARLHSERALLNQMHELREASENAGQGNPLAGRSLRMRGTKPPCENCHRAMAAFVEQNQMGPVDYVWKERPHGGDSAVRYEAGSSPRFGGYQADGEFNESLAGQHAQRLSGAYAMQGGNMTPGARRDVNRESRPGGYTFVSGGNAQGTYRDLNTKHYK